MKKKIFSLIVLCSLLITLLPAKSYAVDTNEEFDFFVGFYIFRLLDSNSLICYGISIFC